MARTDHVEKCGRCGHEQQGGMEYCRHCGLPLYARPTGWRPRTWWRWTCWFVLHKVLHVDDTPHRIALGLAIGMFIAWTPTVGFQMVLTALVAWLLRANKIVGVPLVWITNPVTMGPIYYFNYRIGELVLGAGGKTLAHFQKLAHDRGGVLANLVYAWQLLMDAFWRCWIGSMLAGLALAVLTYLMAYWGVMTYRSRHRKLFPGSRFDEQGRPIRADKDPQAK